MKKVLTFLLCCVGFQYLPAQSNCLPGNNGGYSDFWNFTSENGSCAVGFELCNDVVENLFIGGNTVCASPLTRFQLTPIPGAVVKLEKKQANGTWQQVSQHDITSGRKTGFHDLQDGTYRARYFISTTNGIPLTPVAKPNCEQPFGLQGFLDLGLGALTKELEITTAPTADFTILDFYGTPFNKKFCYGDPVWMDAENCFGEQWHFVQIEMQNMEGQPQGWTGSNFYGQAGYIDLLNDVWRAHHPEWDFWPNHKYKVNLSVTGCAAFTPWTDHEDTFTVLVAGGQCRTGLISAGSPQLNVYPNPARQSIRIDGINLPDPTESKYSITDLAGRQFKEGQILDFDTPIDIENLSSGLYIIKIHSNAGSVAAKFSVLK